MAKIVVNDEQMAAALVTLLLLEKALQHLDSEPAGSLYSNELYWFRQARREMAWFISQIDGYTPSLLDFARETGLQLLVPETQAGGGGELE